MKKYLVICLIGLVGCGGSSGGVSGVSPAPTPAVDPSPTPSPKSCLAYIEQRLVDMLGGILAGQIQLADVEAIIVDIKDAIDKQSCPN